MRSNLFCLLKVATLIVTVGVACYKRPTKYESSYKWQIIKTFDKEISITKLFRLNDCAWAIGVRVDLSDPRHPKSHNILLRTTDNWKTHTEQPLPGGNLWDLCFLNDSTGWCVGSAGTLLNTDDGGVTWQKIDLRTTNGWMSIFFRNAQEGWLGGGTVFKTIDGGQTSVRKYYPNNLSINAHICFITEELGFTTGISDLPASSGLFKTTNGGESWQLLYHPTHIGIRSFNTVDGIHIWYVDGVLVGSNDGGATWYIADYNIQGSEIKFFSLQEGIVVGNKAIWRTSDGGVNWSKEDIEIPREAGGIVRGFHIISSNDIWSWGQNVIFHYQ
ncbi:MAG: YCF48-related protein [candidate division KSB1 bacterium]|nr:YCF48-related protein [candidate division KSB1 bacterium]